MTGAALPPASGYRERNSTADRALDILLLFDDRHLVLTPADIARHLEVSRSTSYRYLQSLAQSGFIEDAGGGGFRLGPKVLELARLARRGIGLLEVARPVLHALAADVGETALLTRLAGRTVICLEREEAGDRLVRISYERGQVLPSNAGASALALLAWLPEPRVREVLGDDPLESFTERTLTQLPEVLQRLAETREQGFAVSRGELDPDVLGIGAPVLDAQGDVLAAVSVAAVSARVPDDQVPRLAAAVCAAAAEISTALQLAG